MTTPATTLDATVRHLPSGVVISSEMFARKSPSEQADIVNKARGKAITFVSSFSVLRNKRTLRDQLLAGTDVTLALEFNDISLTAEERAALTAVRPVLEKIQGVSPLYPWLNPNEPLSEHWVVTDRYIERHTGYKATVLTAKKVWDKASAYWSMSTLASKRKELVTGSFDGYHKTVYVSHDTLEIGCQSIARNHIEAIARHYGWDPVSEA